MSNPVAKVAQAGLNAAGQLVRQLQRPLGGQATGAGDGEPRSRWRCVTINKGAQEVMPNGRVPDPLAALGDRVEVQVREAPGGKGTELAARLRQPEPSGIGSVVARVSGDDPASRSGRRCAKPNSSSRSVRCCGSTPPRTAPAPPPRPASSSSSRPAARVGGSVMKALCWTGVNETSVETVDDPKILNDRDIILKVKLSTTCGSDLHLLGGYIPTMRAGDVLGHEFMGEVVEIGSAVRTHQVGDRVVVGSFIACGQCWYCQNKLFSLCDNGNPTPR